MRTERGRGQELVRERVEERSQARDLVAAAREVPVEVVGEDGEAEDANPEHEPAVRPRPREEHDHEDGDEEDPEDGQGVREVH